MHHEKLSSMLNAQYPIVCLNEHQCNFDNAIQYHKWCIFTIHNIFNCIFQSVSYSFDWWFGWWFSSLCFSALYRIGLQLFCGAFDHTNIEVTLNLFPRSNLCYLPFLFYCLLFYSPFNVLCVSSRHTTVTQI